MEPRFGLIWKSLKVVPLLEKCAEEDPSCAEIAQDKIAQSCNEIFGEFMTVAARYPGIAMYEKAANAAMALRETAEFTGVKTASVDDSRELVVKLAAAALLDHALSNTLGDLPPASKLATEQVIFLGREYGTHLLRGLIGA